jgi:hypothetical protein
MKCPKRLRRWLRRKLISGIAQRRAPDAVIKGPDGGPYLSRWWVIPRNAVFNVYLHRITQSDDDRALHDHPWVNLSILLCGQYDEHTIAAGGIHRRTRRQVGDMKARTPWSAHRLELVDGDCWTLFLTGPRLRQWGFHCPKGWRPHEQFNDPNDPGAIGRGCD